VSDTQHLKTHVEDEVRAWLTKEFGQTFRKDFLQVGIKSDGSPAVREFDAISTDGQIVASIKASTWITVGGNQPAAKVHSFYTELYFFDLIGKRAKKLLIFTDAAARNGFAKICDGKKADDVELMPFELSSGIRREADLALAAASREIRIVKPRKR